MKLRQLPAIDLANIATKSAKDKYTALRPFALPGGGGWSYAPAREHTFNIFNPEDPMGLLTDPPTFRQVLRDIRRACNSTEQRDSCSEVAKILWRWVKTRVLRSVERQIPSTSIGALGTVRYWENFLGLYEGKPTIFFMDHRRGKGLTAAGRRFVWSMMNERVRKVFHDLKDVQLAILKFEQHGEEKRGLQVHIHRDEVLFTARELDAMLQETHDVFTRVTADEIVKARGGRRKRA